MDILRPFNGKVMKRQILCVFVMFGLIQGAFAEPEPDEVRTYKKVDEHELTLHVFYPNGQTPSDRTPAIVFFFGGGWTSGTPRHFYRQSEYLSSRGMVAICADYRVKNRHGTTPDVCVKDGKSAIRWIRSHSKELGIDPDRLVAGGGSAGGQVAAATAFVDGFNQKGEDTSVSCRPDALALFNPVIDNGPEGYGYARVKSYWRSFSPLHNIGENAPPTVFFLGTEDDLIPVKTARKFKKRIEQAGGRCDLYLYSGQGHGFFNENEYRDTLYKTDQFLRSLGYLNGEPSIKNKQASGSQ